MISGLHEHRLLAALSHMEKSSRTINDIDEALARIADRTYGVCMTCTGCQQTLENEARGNR